MIRGAALALVVIAAPVDADPLLFDHGRLFIQIRIDGVPSEALLDSGAEATLVDSALAARSKMPEGKQQTIRGSGGETKARLVEGVTIEAVGVQLHPEAIVVTDLSDLSKRLIKRPTQAIVGRELFDAARLSVDIPRGKIRVLGSDQAPRGTRLPLTAHAGIEAVPVSVGGEVVQAEFDLGNGSDVLISRSLARRLNLKVVGRKSGGGIGGAVQRDMVKLGLLEVAGTRFRNVDAAIDDQPNANELNIGTSILKNFLITTDFKNRAVWLEPVCSVHP
jgi:predicted aspartyl protease